MINMVSEESTITITAADEDSNPEVLGVMGENAARSEFAGQADENGVTMITQRITYNNDGTAVLTISAQPSARAELQGLADELALRSNVSTEGPIHLMNDPADNQPTHG